MFLLVNFFSRFSGVARNSYFSRLVNEFISRADSRGESKQKDAKNLVVRNQTALIPAVERWAFTSQTLVAAATN